MATEIEMKLAVPSRAVLDEILQDPQLTEHMRDALGHKHMSSTYYDTEDGVLQSRRWTLRLRDEGGTRVVAMKTPNASGQKGLFTRREWQCRADRPEEAVERLVSQGAPRELLHLLRGRTLVPICSAQFERRSTCLYLPDGVRIEIAADEGTLSANGREAPICELELELLFGDSEALPPVAHQLIESYGLVEEARSKFQRALALRLAPEEDAPDESDESAAPVAPGAPETVDA